MCNDAYSLVMLRNGDLSAINDAYRYAKEHEKEKHIDREFRFALGIGLLNGIAFYRSMLASQPNIFLDAERAAKVRNMETLLYALLENVETSDIVKYASTMKF